MFTYVMASFSAYFYSTALRLMLLYILSIQRQKWENFCLDIKNSPWKDVTFRGILHLNHKKRKKYSPTTLKNVILGKKNFESHSSHLNFALSGDICAA